MVLTTEIVSRRARAKQRARHFFDLSHDMLCTANTDGLLHRAERCLGAGLG